MAYNLASLRRGKEIRPPRIVIYGPHGLGKSGFGAGAPNPVFIQTEDGIGHLDVAHFPLSTSYADVLGQIGALYTEEHDHQTLIIDSADWLETLVWKETCRIHGKADIEEFGYGKGYVAALDVWRTLFDGLIALRDEKNMAVIFTAHCQIKRFDSPETEPYDRYSPKLHHGASALIQEWSDAVLFTNYRTVVQKEDVGFNQKAARGITTGQRMLYTTEKPAYLAKNRYNLPPEIVLPESVGGSSSFAAFQNAMAAALAPAPAAPAVPT